METPDETKREDDTGSFQVEPPVRQRVADHVFETLARAIFNKELKPGEPLPTQRELAKRFKISALVVRQAIHRLEDMASCACARAAPRSSSTRRSPTTSA